MKLIGITQRVDIHPTYGERRDALDQRWYQFFLYCGFIPILIPNCIKTCRALLARVQLDGFVFTGGNSPMHYAGDAPERDDVEAFLIEHCETVGLPILGVCRGMQMIQLHYGGSLDCIKGHVNKIIEIKTDEEQLPRFVNSYHTLATTITKKPLLTKAKSSDNIVKAIEHSHYSIFGIMWHPERNTPYCDEDIQLFKDIF